VPLHCRQKAHDLFAAQAQALDAPGALLRAAVAISMHELPDARPADVEAALDGFAARVRDRVRSGQPRAFLAHLHHVLFEEEGFTGADLSLRDASASYLPRVIETKKGLPITLALVYKEVGERVGLEVTGVNAPGHFLAAVAIEGRRMLVDPFAGGRLLSKEEAFVRIERISGRALPRTDDLLRTATPRQWLARMIQNLLRIFSAADRDADVAAMLELRELL